jgi:two-component system response regulator DctR
MVNKDAYEVLLIEDDPMVQEVNRQFIEQVSGFKIVGMASNGVEGLEKLRNLRPDLIFLDIYMPNQNGVETLYKIREEDHQVYVVVVTAADDTETMRQMLQQGAKDYIIKPFKFDRIKKALDNYKLYRQIMNKPFVTQSEIDQILHPASSEGLLDLPKGLNLFTLNQVSSYLHGQTEAKSAEEVAEVIGIARVTARRYLDYFVKKGTVKIDIQYGGVGRPVNRYIQDQNDQN